MYGLVRISDIRQYITMQMFVLMKISQIVSVQYHKLIIIKRLLLVLYSWIISDIIQVGMKLLHKLEIVVRLFFKCLIYTTAVKINIDKISFSNQ